MSLWGTLNVAKTALATHQVALQTVGNNIANAGNENYVRENAHVVATKGQEIRPGMFVGTGVDVQSIERQIDESVEQRLRASISDSEGNAQASQWLTRTEAVFNELSDEDLSTGMSTFFNSWSELANKPQDVGLRQVVVQDGANLAQQFKSVRAQLDNLRGDLSNKIKVSAADADKLASQVADLNKTIALTEGGGGQADALRDQRDAVLKDLSKLTNLTVSPGDNGMVNVFIGSEPLIMGTQSRGITVRQDDPANPGDAVQQTLVFKADDGTIPVNSGVLGAVSAAKQTLDAAVKNVDDLASSLIFELNKLHSAGQGLAGSQSVLSDVAVADTTVALTDKKADLDFKPTNGSFVVHVKDKATGAVTSTLINVDLDGNGADTTLDSLAASIDGIDNINADTTAGRLRIKTDSDAVEVSFSQDSSGVLASLGVGTFFSGSNARDIAIKADLAANPKMLAAAKNGQPADNQTAKAIAELATKSLASLGDRSLDEAYQSQVNDISARVEGARKDSDAAQVVRDTLQSQHDAISGVSLDEEAINLMKYQRAYQAASRVIAATDEMLQQILNLV